MRLRAGLLGIAALALAVCTRDVPVDDSQAPPRGAERERMVGHVREDYPAMPEALVGMLTNVRRQLSDDVRCELAEWLAAPASGAPAGAMALSRRLIDYCSLATDDLSAGAVKARLKGEDFRFDIAGDELTLLAHSSESRVDVCCSMQVELTRIDDGPFWAARRRMAGLDRSMLSLFVARPERTAEKDIQRFRGANAPPDPRRVALSLMRGQTFDRELKSEALGETRKLRIYLPPGWSRDKVWPALFLADNSAASYASLVEAMIDDGEIVPIVLISAESGGRAVVGATVEPGGPDLRSAEYIRHDTEGDRFDRHMAFFTRELTAYAVSEFGVSTRREDRAVAGYSSGGVFALWAGLLHPEVYGMAVPMSPGIAALTADDLTTGVRARFRFAGGAYEPAFLETAQAAEAVLREGGYDVSGRYLAAGHDPDQWRIVLRHALIEAFPAP